jgi:DNA-binding phage protein
MIHALIRAIIGSKRICEFKGENQMRPFREYKQDLAKELKNPTEAAGYLNAALADGDPKVFLLALRDVAEAQGGTSCTRR